VAKFMLNIMESNEYLKKGVAVDLPKPPTTPPTQPTPETAN
jgi:hypothetical protein